MKRIHTLIATLICTAAFAASSLASLSYGAELSDPQTGSEVSNLRTVESGTCGENLSWKLDDEGTLTISGTGKMKDYSDSDPSPWDDSRSSVKTVVVKSGVTSIGNYAFYFCISLQNITIPSSVTSIGEHAFFECTSLQSITIPSGVTSIGDYAFTYCWNLQSITIPSSVTIIEVNTFSSCTSLESITIPSSVTSIGDYAFEGCDSLHNITIPSSVTSIGYKAFADCSSLGTVYYNGSESDWNGIDINEDNDPLTSDKVLFNQIFAKGVSLDKDSLTLASGESAVLSAALIPADAILDTMIWSSADPGIAKVDDDGTVTAVAEGKTTVTAMSAAWGCSADCSVVVKKADDSGENIKRTKPANTFVGGQKVDVKTLYFSSFPEATRFQSSSKKTASVSKKGILKAKKPGTVTIEAQTGKKKTERKNVSSCSLTILEKPKLKFKVKYSAATDIGKVLDGYGFFTTESTKQTAADYWESSKPAVAEINPETGVITIKGKGAATITAYFGKKGEKGTLKVKAKLKVKK